MSGGSARGLGWARVGVVIMRGRVGVGDVGGGGGGGWGGIWGVGVGWG